MSDDLLKIKEKERVTREEAAARLRAIADELRRDPARLQRLVEDARRSREAPSVADAVKPTRSLPNLSPQTIGAAAGAAAALVGGIVFRRRKSAR